MPPAPIRGGAKPPPPASAFTFVAPAEPAAREEPAEMPEYKAPEPAAVSPALPSDDAAPMRAVPSYVAVLPIFVGGDRGTVPIGAPYKPADDAERIRFLSQGAIREV